MPEREVLLLVNEISKSFPGILALDSVSLVLHAGEVHALIGANGAGKSTLVKIIAGALQPDRGSITIGGKTFRALTPLLARKVGIAAVYQEQQLVPDLTVAENVFLGKEPKTALGRVDYRRMLAETGELIQAYGFSIQPSDTVGELPLAQRQEVAILKALKEQARVLLLDEPTAALTGPQVTFMFHLIEQLRKQGIGILYISHHIDEILSIAQRITVLRNGKNVGTFLTQDVTKEMLIEKMVGRRIERGPSFPRAPSGGVALEVQHLAVDGRVENVSFLLREREILGLSGSAGSGCREILRSIAGLLPPRKGQIQLFGKPFRPRGTVDAIQQGVLFMPEDMRKEGLVLPLPFPRNITLAKLQKVTSRGIIVPAKEIQAVQPYIASLRIVAPSLWAETRVLSGGNQRKVLLAKALFTDARIWLLEDPTQGVDVETRQEIHRLIIEARNSGRSILLFSSDLEELLTLSDRIMVMYKGTLVKEVDNPAMVTAQELLSMTLGG
ncbi:sugar ABC transporter ATP-binding protein [Candidatus Caldatribacterium sp. SIUC1]|uniref:sugar ABC transporter ATP-binding protein n=1 Tax=Candidatus Caldatribacterium sp. SIUC1 TaxID=3418365 RepID=UPI003F6912DB